MAKYLIKATYTPQGIQGLMADSASGRRSDVTAAIKAAGGTVESFYFCFGEDDVIVIADVPDNVAAAALSLSTTATGAVRCRVTPLLTVEEVDQALEIQTRYRAPGS
jgi:uncharacterized protein with GYD domain